DSAQVSREPEVRQVRIGISVDGHVVAERPPRCDPLVHRRYAAHPRVHIRYDQNPHRPALPNALAAADLAAKSPRAQRNVSAKPVSNGVRGCHPISVLALLTSACTERCSPGRAGARTIFDGSGAPSTARIACSASWLMEVDRPLPRLMTWPAVAGVL